MASQLPARLRRLIYQVHLWVAVFLFLLLVPLGLSGVVLAWPEQVNAPFRASPQVAASDVAALSPSAYLAAARGALSEGARVQSLRLPAQPGEAVAVSANTGAPGPAGGRTVWLDPADGHLLKVGPSTSPLFSWSHDFHGAFMIRGAGRQLVGWAGVAMLALSLSGLWLWWPRGRSFLRGFRWRRTPDTLLNLHHQLGFWISLPLAILSLTGIFISFPPLAAAVLGGGAPRPPAAEGAPRPHDEAGRDSHDPGAAAHAEHGGRRGAGHGAGGDAGGGRPRLTPEQAVAAALAARPEAPRLIALTLPGAGRGPGAPQHAWRVDLGGPAGQVSVLVDEPLGAVRDAPSRERPHDAQWMNRQVHDGGGSVIWKLIVSLVGIAPALLAITGLITWLRSQARRAQNRRTMKAA